MLMCLLCSAMKLLHEVGLASIGGNTVGSGSSNNAAVSGSRGQSVAKSISGELMLWILGPMLLIAVYDVGGQRRRLSIALEMIGDPSVLFLDEVSLSLCGILNECLWCSPRQDWMPPLPSRSSSFSTVSAAKSTLQSL